MSNHRPRKLNVALLALIAVALSAWTSAQAGGGVQWGTVGTGGRESEKDVARHEAIQQRIRLTEELISRTRLLMDQGMYVEAEDVLGWLPATDPSVRELRGEVLLRQGKHAEALQILLSLYQDAEESFDLTMNTRLLLKIGLLMCRLDRLGESHAIWNRVLEIVSTEYTTIRKSRLQWLPVPRNRGELQLVLLLGVGEAALRFEDQRFYLAEAVRLAPDSAAANLMLGDLLMLRKAHLAEALPFLEAAVQNAEGSLKEVAGRLAFQCRQRLMEQSEPASGGPGAY